MRRTLRAMAMAVPAGLIAATLAGTNAAAAPATVVTTNADSGAGSLRSAIAAANAADGGTIVIRNGVGTITLASQLTYDGSGSLTIQGGGAIVTADAAATAFHLLRTTGGGALTVSNLTLTGAQGSGLVVEVPTDATADQAVRLQQVTVSGNGLNGVYVDDCGTDLDAVTPAQCPDTSSGSAVGVVLDLSGTTISGNGFRVGQKDFDGIRVNERGAGSITATFSDSSVVDNAADGVELDEDAAGDVTLKVRGGSFSDNGEQPQDTGDREDAIDIDERGDGSVDTDLVNVKATNNWDENLDFNESAEGDLVSRAQQVDVTGAKGGRGYDLEEGGGGSLTATVTNLTASASDSDGMRAQERDAGDVSLDVNQAQFVDNGGAGLEIDEKGDGTGMATLKNSTFSGNAQAIKIDGQPVTLTTINVVGA